MENAATTTNKKAEQGANSHSRPPVPPFHTGSLQVNPTPSSATAIAVSPASTQSNSNSTGLTVTPAAATLSSNAAFYASFFLPITFYKSLEYRLDRHPIFLRRTLRYGLAEIIDDRTRTPNAAAHARESPVAQQNESHDTSRRFKPSSTSAQLPSAMPATSSSTKPSAAANSMPPPSQSTPVGSRRHLRGHSTMAHTDPRAATRPYFHPNDLLGLKLAAAKGAATAVNSYTTIDSDSLNAIRLVTGLASKKLNISIEHVSFHKPSLSSSSSNSTHVPTSSLSRAAAEHALPIARSLQVAAHLLHHRNTVAVLSDQIQRTENDSMSIPPSLGGFPFPSSTASEDVLSLAPQHAADVVCAYSKTNFAFSTINFLEQDIVSQSKRVFRNKNLLRRTHFAPAVGGPSGTLHAHHGGFNSSSNPANTTASAVVHASHQKFSRDWCVQIGLAATLQKASSAAYASEGGDHKHHAKTSHAAHAPRTSSLESKNNTRPSDCLESSTSLLYEDGTAHEDGNASSSTRPPPAAYTISLPLLRAALNGTHNLIDDGLVRAPIILRKQHAAAHDHAHSHEDEAGDIVVGSALLRVQWIYQIHATHLNSQNSLAVSPSPSPTPATVATRSMVLSAAPRGVRIPASIRTSLKSPKAMLVAWRYVYKTSGLPCGSTTSSNSTGNVPSTTADKNSAHADQMAQFESMLTKSPSPFQSPAPAPSSTKGDVYTQIEYRPNFNCTLCGFQSETHVWSFDQLIRHMDSCHSEYLLFKYGTAARFTLEDVDDDDATIDTYEIAVTPKDCLSLLSLIAAPHSPKVDVTVSDNDEVTFLSHNEWLASLSDKKGTIKGLPKVFVDALKQSQALQSQSPQPPASSSKKPATGALPSPTTTSTPSSISTLLVLPPSPSQAQQQSVQQVVTSPSPPPVITEPIPDSPHRFFFFVGFKYCASMLQRRAALAAIAANNRYSRQQDKISSTAPASALGNSLKLTDDNPPSNMSVKSLLQSSQNFAKAKALKDEVLRRATATQKDGAAAAASSTAAVPLPPVPTFRSRRTTPARHSSALYSRQWYHASTGQPVAICDLGNDSDECADEEWFFASKSQLIDEFDDVSSGEKQFMKIWNEFVLRKQNANEAIYADYLFPNVCASFARICAPLLRGHLRSAFLCHLLTSWEFGLLHYAHIEACMRMVDQFSQGVPIEAGAAYISFHAPSRNPAYASDRCATEAEYQLSLALNGTKSLHAGNRNSPHKKPKGQVPSAAGSSMPPTVVSPTHLLPSGRGRFRSDGSSTPVPAIPVKRKYKRSGDAKRAALRSSQNGRRVTRSADKPDTPSDAKKITRTRQSRNADAMDTGSSSEEEEEDDGEDGDESDEEEDDSGSESASQDEDGDDASLDGDDDGAEAEASDRDGSASSSSDDGDAAPRYSQRWAAVQAAGNIRKSLHTEKLRSAKSANRAASSSSSRPQHAQMKKALPDEEQEVSEEEEESSPVPSTNRHQARGYPLRSKQPVMVGRGKRPIADDDDDLNDDAERKRNVSDEDEGDHMNDGDDHEDEGKEHDSSSKPPHKRARFAVQPAAASASSSRSRYRR